MTRPATPRSDKGSTTRIIIGVGLVVAAIVTTLIGFVRLITVLEEGGYGTQPMRTALVILGAAGACLAGGVATLIWDVAKRYESPGEPQVRDRDLPR